MAGSYINTLKVLEHGFPSILDYQRSIHVCLFDQLSDNYISWTVLFSNRLKMD